MTFDIGRVRHAMDLMHFSIGSNGSSIPSNWIPAATGDSGIGWQPPAGSGTTILANGSNSLSGAVNLVAGTSIAITTSGQNITIADTGAAGGGGTGTRAFGLDRASFDPTYGDDFDAASLNGRWTHHNAGTAVETFQAGGLGSIYQVAHDATNAAQYIYQTDPNNTNQTWEASYTLYQDSGSNQMWGIICVSSSGTGVALMHYDNSPGLYLANVSSHAFSSSLTTKTVFEANAHRQGARVWLRLRKAGGTYFGSMSFDGQLYRPEISGTPSAFTPARIGIGRFLGTTASAVIGWHWFDKTA
jgi:hypothetical protein